MVEQRDPATRVDRNFWIVTACFAVLSVIAVWYCSTASLDSFLPRAAAEPAFEVDLLLRFMASVASVLFIVVAGYILYFSFAFRAKKTDAPDAIGVQIHDHHALELWWTLIPAILVVTLSIFSVKIWYQIQVQPSAGSLVVEAIGHQWYYTFRYPGVHGEVSKDMYLPVNVPVTLNTTSSDVIHSFWVPAFRLKADMVPGLINTIRFTPTVIGPYPLICTEFCGTDHGLMKTQRVIVVSQADYAVWLHKTQMVNAHVSDALATVSAGAVSLAGGDAGAGKALFAQKCSACHAIAPFTTKVVGPGLKGLLDDPAHPNLVTGDKASPVNIAKILQNGFTGDIGTMPNQAANGLSDKDIANLVAYLSSLK